MLTLHLGLAEAYFALEKADKAIEMLEKDIEQNDRDKLRDKLEEIRERLKPVTTLGREYDVAATYELDLSQAEITDEILTEIIPEKKSLRI